MKEEGVIKQGTRTFMIAKIIKISVADFITKIFIKCLANKTFP